MHTEACTGHDFHFGFSTAIVKGRQSQYQGKKLKCHCSSKPANKPSECLFSNSKHKRTSPKCSTELRTCLPASGSRSAGCLLHVYLWALGLLSGWCSCLPGSRGKSPPGKKNLRELREAINQRSASEKAACPVMWFWNTSSLTARQTLPVAGLNGVSTNQKPKSFQPPSGIQTSAQQAHTKRGLSLYSTHNAQGPSWQKRPNCDPNNKCTHSTKQILDSMIIQSHLASKTRWNNQYSWPQWSYSKTVILRDFCSTMPVYMNCMWLTHDYCAPVSGPLLCHYIS